MVGGGGEVRGRRRRRGEGGGGGEKEEGRRRRGEGGGEGEEETFYSNCQNKVYKYKTRVQEIC